MTKASCTTDEGGSIGVVASAPEMDVGLDGGSSSAVFHFNLTFGVHSGETNAVAVRDTVNVLDESTTSAGPSSDNGDTSL